MSQTICLAFQENNQQAYFSTPVIKLVLKGEKSCIKILYVK